MVLRDETNDNQKLYPPVVGPYDEATRLGLICEVEQGQPSEGHVSWWQLESVQQPPLDYLAATTTTNGPPLSLTAQVPLSSANYLTTLSLPTATTASDDGTGPLHDANLFLMAHSPHSTPAEQQPISSSLLASFSWLQFGQKSAVKHADPHAVLNESQVSTNNWRLKNWRRVHNQTTQTLGEKLQATIELASLSRSNLADEFMCLANNNDFSPPLNTTIRLNLNRKYHFG